MPAHWGVDGTATPGKGLMVLGVDRNSPLAQQRGVTQGSVITSVAGIAVSNIPQLQEILDRTPEEKCTIEFADVEPPARPGSQPQGQLSATPTPREVAALAALLIVASLLLWAAFVRR